MNREDRSNRHYDTSPLSVVRGDPDTEEGQDMLLTLYCQVVSVWKELVGVRFKLLLLLPAATLALLIPVLSVNTTASVLPWFGKLLICLLGLAVTAGLFIYDQRNSALHDDLISRGRKIESELGIDTGIFLGRIKADGIFKHDNATNLIYGSTLVAWIIALAILLLVR